MPSFIDMADDQVALTEDSAQALTRVCDLIPRQKTETFKDRADTIELGGHGTRLGVDGRAETTDLARQACPLGAGSSVLLAMRAAVHRMLTHRET